MNILWYIFSEIKREVCLNDVDQEHEDYLSKKTQEEDEEQVASHPVLLYKLIKQMNWFSQEVYQPKLQSVASNKGNSRKFADHINPNNVGSF